MTSQKSSTMSWLLPAALNHQEQLTHRQTPGEAWLRNEHHHHHLSDGGTLAERGHLGWASHQLISTNKTLPGPQLPLRWQRGGSLL